MQVSSSSSYQLPAALEGEQSLLVLKKQQDVAKAEGQALVALIEQSSPIQSRASAGSGGFSAYA